MSVKKIMKRKIATNSSYVEMLSTYAIADLKAIVKEWKIKGTSKLKKDELVETIESHIMENLDEKMFHFNLDHLTIVNGLMNGENKFNQFPVAAHKLINAGLIVEGNIDGERQVLMHQEVAKKFFDYCKENYEALTYNSVIKDYMELAIALYGVMDEAFFVNSFYEFNEGATDEETIRENLAEHAANTSNALYDNGMIYYYRLGEYQKVWEDINKKDEIAYRQIEPELLKAFVQNGNTLWHEYYVRFNDVLKENFPNRNVYDTVDELLIMNAYNHGVSNYIQMVSNKEGVEDMQAVKAFADVAIAVNNEIPHWELKGHSPMMLSKTFKQQPIVKGDKIGRNDPCPCGSGKKYKKCCINK